MNNAAIRLFLVSSSIFLFGIVQDISGDQLKEIELGPDTHIKNIQEPFDYFSNNWTVIALKDYERGTRVTPEGAWILDDGVVCKPFIGPDKSFLNAQVSRTLANGHLPIVLFDFVLNHELHYTIEMFAIPWIRDWRAAYEGPNRENYINWMQITIENPRSANAIATWGWKWEPLESIQCRKLFENRHAIYGGGALRGVLQIPNDTTITAQDDALQLDIRLRPQGSATIDVAIPFQSISRFQNAAASELALLDYETWRERTESFWEVLLERGAQLSVPESKVQETYLASLVYQFITRDHNEVHPGEGFYDTYYIRDAAYQAISLAYAGFLDECAEGLEPIKRYQQESGQLMSQKGQFDANGYGVWAPVEYYRLTQDRDWLEAWYPILEKAVDFTRTMRRTETDPSSPYYGVLPRALADGEYLWDGSCHILGYDWWNLRAVQSLAYAAEVLGKTGKASELQKEFEDYRGCILKALDKTGLEFIPPSYEKKGTHWGNLEVIFPTQLIDKNDTRVGATLHEVRDNFGGGFVEGIIQWRPSIFAIHPYMSQFVTNSFIIRGEYEEAVDGFYSFLLHTTATHGFPEGIYYKKREAWSDTLPHTWAAALYVITLRNMLIREEGETLHLLSAVPGSWLEPGQRIRFHRVPTHFGEMGLETVAENERIRIQIHTPSRNKPETVAVHLPPHLEILSASCGEKSLEIASPGVVQMPGEDMDETVSLTLDVQRKDAPIQTFESTVAAYLKGLEQ